MFLLNLYMYIILLVYAKATIEWKVHTKASNFGDTIQIFCSVDANTCCSATAGWGKWTTNGIFKTIVHGIKGQHFDSNAKYQGKMATNGFYLLIKIEDEHDFNVNYSCTYGLRIGPGKLLTFKEAIGTPRIKITDNFFFYLGIFLILSFTVIFLQVKCILNGTVRLRLMWRAIQKHRDLVTYYKVFIHDYLQLYPSKYIYKTSMGNAGGSGSNSINSWIRRLKKLYTENHKLTTVNNHPEETEYHLPSLLKKNGEQTSSSEFLSVGSSKETDGSSTSIKMLNDSVKL